MPHSNSKLSNPSNFQEPTENIFYQCSDISIQSNSLGATPPTFVGLQNSNSSSTTEFVVVLDGQILPQFPIQFGVQKTQSSSDFVTNGVVGTLSGNLVYTASIDGTGSFPNYLYLVDYPTQETNLIELSQKNPVFGNNVDPLISLFEYPSGNLMGLQLVPNNTALSNWYYTLVSVASDSGNVKVLTSFDLNDDTFVNFQWSELDNSTGTLYVLAGKTNAIFSIIFFQEMKMMPLD